MRIYTIKHDDKIIISGTILEVTKGLHEYLLERHNYLSEEGELFGDDTYWEVMNWYLFVDNYPGEANGPRGYSQRIDDVDVEFRPRSASRPPVMRMVAHGRPTVEWTEASE